MASKTNNCRVVKSPNAVVNLAVAIGGLLLLLSESTCFAQGLSWPDQCLQDLAVLRSSYVEKTLALTSERRQKALRIISELERRTGSLTPASFQVGVYEVAATADNAHDTIFFNGRFARSSVRMPVRLIWFPDGLVIARAQGVSADIVGGRVTAIEDHTPDVLFGALKKLCGGLEVHCKCTLPALIESGGILHSLGLAASPTSLRLSITMPDGRHLDRQIQMISAESIQQPPEGPGRLWSPDPIPGEEVQGWRSALNRASAPLYLRDGEMPFRKMFLPAANALYIQYRANASLAGHDIRAFTESVLKQIEAQHPRHLVFDFRFNRGGDMTTTMRAMRQMPKMVPGRTFILVGRYTFSAGIVSAAILKNAAGERAVVVGEELGDRLRFWSEGGAVCLPNSGMCVQRNDGLWDLAKGCHSEPHCYGDQFDANVGSLAVGVQAPLTAAEYLSSRDPGMQAVIARSK